MAKTNLLKFATYTLLLTAVLHLIMPFLHGANERTTPTAIAGAIYLIIALGLLFTNKKAFLWAAAIMTIIGMIGASFKWTQVSDHYPLDIWFIIFDVLIVPVFWYSLFKK